MGMKKLALITVTLIALAILLPSGSAFAWHGYYGFGFVAPPLLLPPPPPVYYGGNYAPPSYDGPGYYNGYNGPYRAWIRGYWAPRWTPYGWRRGWVPGYWR
jgi:hypothetical protein